MKWFNMMENNNHKEKKCIFTLKESDMIHFLKILKYVDENIEENKNLSNHLSRDNKKDPRKL